MTAADLLLAEMFAVWRSDVESVPIPEFDDMPARASAVLTGRSS